MDECECRDCGWLASDAESGRGWREGKEESGIREGECEEVLLIAATAKKRVKQRVDAQCRRRTRYEWEEAEEASNVGGCAAVT